jgi:hypothetical protein
MTISNVSRPDVVSVTSAPRPTPTPARTSFKEVLTKTTGIVARGAEAALSVVPGGPVVATALRSGAGISGYGSAAGPVGGGMSAEGPGAGGSTGNAGSGIDGALAKGQEDNMYYLNLQMQMQQQNQQFSTLSNVIKAEHDTAKNAIGNIR